MFSSKRNILLVLCGLVSSFIVLTNASLNCDPQTCTGPLFYYQELGCIPIYDNSSSCCARKYNCDYWKNVPDSKCFVNGRLYESNENLPPQEVGGSCTRYICAGGAAPARAVTPSCAGPQLGCYLKKEPLQCCSNVEVCPEKEEDIPTCTVDDKTYKDGEEFIPSSEPNKICTCGAGYTDIKDARYCVTKGPGWCGNAMWNVEKIQQNCAPVYPFGVDPRNNCNEGYRCQKENDAVVDSATTEDSEPTDPDMMCKYGNLLMKVGQMLNQLQDEPRPMECVCEVPPVVTCRYLEHVADVTDVEDVTEVNSGSR